MKKITTRSLSRLAFVSAGFVGLLFAAEAFAATTFTEPASAPPGGDAAAPLNVSGNAQTKSGALTVSGLFTATNNINIPESFGSLNLNGNQVWNSEGALYLQYSGSANSNVVVGGQAGVPQDLDIANGTAWANQFCINGTADCLTSKSFPLGGGGGGSGTPGGSNGQVQVNNNGSFAGIGVYGSNDQGGSLEIGSGSGGNGTPYIDFHYGNAAQDYNTRIVNDANGQLTVIGKLRTTDSTPGPQSILQSPYGQLQIFPGWSDGYAYIEAGNSNGNGNNNGITISGYSGNDTPAINLRATTVNIDGRLGVDGKSGNSGYPSGWGGGIHTFDLYAEGTVGAGVGGSLNAYMSSNGSIYSSTNINAAGTITAAGTIYGGYIYSRGNVYAAGDLETSGDVHFDRYGQYYDGSFSSYVVGPTVNDSPYIGEGLSCQAPYAMTAIAISTWKCGGTSDCPEYSIQCSHI